MIIELMLYDIFWYVRHIDVDVTATRMPVGEHINMFAPGDLVIFRNVRLGFVMTINTIDGVQDDVSIYSPRSSMHVLLGER